MGPGVNPLSHSDSSRAGLSGFRVVGYAQGTSPTSLGLPEVVEEGSRQVPVRLEAFQSQDLFRVGLRLGRVPGLGFVRCRVAGLTDL